MVVRFGMVLITIIFSLSNIVAQTAWEKLKTISKENSLQEIIFLDNKYIQSYQTRLGIWHQSNNYSAYARKYKVTVKEIKKINKIKKYSSRSWIFYPYSESYIKKLTSIGILRRSIKVAAGEYIWPVHGSKITSRIGKRWGFSHEGLDIALGRGSIVLAVSDGIVTQAGNIGAYGVAVTVEHKNGYYTRYAHLSSALISKGDHIKKGQIIAFSGNTGRSTGPHLHFEVRCQKMILDPENFLPAFSNAMEQESEFKADLRHKKSENKKL